MSAFAFRALCLLAVGVASGIPTHAFAAAQRTFVASTGSDAGACSIVAPCRSFAAAILQTIDGGEVIVVDSAGYGPATITKTVAVVAPPGVYAGIFVATGNGIVIDTPGIKVKLAGLTINGQGGDRGIEFTNGDQLAVERCIVRNMAGIGIYVVGAGRQATITDSRLESNGSFGLMAADGANVAVDRLAAFDHTAAGGSAIAAVSNASGAITRMTVSNSTFARNHAAIYAYSDSGLGYVRLASRGNTILAGNGQWGISAQCGNPCAIPNQIIVSSEANSISSASFGIQTFSANTTVIVADSSITQNFVGLLNTAGTIVSMKNNAVEFNVTDTSGVITGHSLQ